MLDIIYILYFLVYFPVLVLRGKWHAGFPQRFGFLPAALLRQLAEEKNLWVHAVSVGEVAAAEGLLRQLQARYPQYRIVLSVATRAGHEFARRKYGSGVLTVWAPLDLTGTVRRFVAAIRPHAYLVVETELWPHLFAELHRQGIPIMLINGRISDEAFPRYRLLRPLLQGTLARISLLCVQSELDARRFIDLGADTARVKVAGNIKFDQPSPGRPADSPAVRRSLGLGGGDLVWVAASTHPGEEKVILRTYVASRRRFPQLRLVIVPRHPERGADVARLAGDFALKPRMFDPADHAPLGGDEVLVVAVIGQLAGIYPAADAVFMGKSLGIPRRGGQNPIEPAAMGRAVVTGAHMENFRDAMRLLRAAGAVIEVGAPGDLGAAMDDLWAHPEHRAGMGMRARVVVEQNRGALEKTMGLIASRL